jgi:serine/threonine protein kinase
MLKQFQMEKAELIYPANYDLVQKLKRCVIGSKTRGSSKSSAAKSVVIKFELDNTVRSRYDMRSQTIQCGNGGSSNDHGQGGFYQRVSTERFIASRMQNKPHFVKFYADLSSQFQLIDSMGNPTGLINTYVYERIENSDNLFKWTKSKRMKKASNSYLEANLKLYFKQIHSALSYLLEQRLVYTDFKPENVMISGNKSFLIDLESVVSLSSRFICLYTPMFAPPLYASDGSLISRNGLAGEVGRYFFSSQSAEMAHDRILSWTYCFSIYILICWDQEDLKPGFNQKFAYWSNENSFMNAFGCKYKRITANLAHLLNTCLVKVHNRHLFQNLAHHSWFISNNSSFVKNLIN